MRRRRSFRGRRRMVRRVFKRSRRRRTLRPLRIGTRM